MLVATKTLKLNRVPGRCRSNCLSLPLLDDAAARPDKFGIETEGVSLQCRLTSGLAGSEAHWPSRAVTSHPNACSDVFSVENK